MHFEIKHIVYNENYIDVNALGHVRKRHESGEIKSPIKQTGLTGRADNRGLSDSSIVPRRVPKRCYSSWHTINLFIEINTNICRDNGPK